MSNQRETTITTIASSIGDVVSLGHMWCFQSELASFFSVSLKGTNGLAEVIIEEGDDYKRKKIPTLSQTGWTEGKVIMYLAVRPCSLALWYDY